MRAIIYSQKRQNVNLASLHTQLSIPPPPFPPTTRFKESNSLDRNDQNITQSTWTCPEKLNASSTPEIPEEWQDFLYILRWCWQLRANVHKTVLSIQPQARWGWRLPFLLKGQKQKAFLLRITYQNQHFWNGAHSHSLLLWSINIATTSLNLKN